MYELVTEDLVDVRIYRPVGTDLGCMSVLVSTELVESVVRYCSLCVGLFCNLVTFAIQKNIEKGTLSNFVRNSTNLPQRHLLRM